MRGRGNGTTDPQPATVRTTVNADRLDDKQTTEWHAAKCIVRKRVQNGELLFLVKFADSTLSWVKEHDVTDELQKRFFIKLATTRKRRQKAARERFKQL